MNDKIQEAFKAGFEKEAQSYWANPEAIEDEAGVLLSPRQENQTRDEIKRMMGQSGARGFTLRHPYLTGIPTLGLAPAIAGQSARQQALKNLKRQDEKLKEEHREERKTRAQETQAGIPTGGATETKSQAQKAKDYLELADKLMDVGKKGTEAYQRATNSNNSRS